MCDVLGVGEIKGGGFRSHFVILYFFPLLLLKQGCFLIHRCIRYCLNTPDSIDCKEIFFVKKVRSGKLELSKEWRKERSFRGLVFKK